jgi:integrase
LQREDSPLLSPNTPGGHLDFRNFNGRHWKPVQKSVGIDPLRDLYDLRHTYATFALGAGVPVLALSRFMGTSDDRSSLRPPRSRRLPARRVARRRARARTGRGRWVDVDAHACKAAPRHGFEAAPKAPLGGRWTLGGR